MSDEKSSTIRRILASPWTQALAAGTLVLVPARKYPSWLRQTLTWGSAAGTAALIAAPAARSAVLRRRTDEQDAEAMRISPAARAGVAVGSGVLVYGSWRFTWWFDTAAESALRRMRVPFPRAVMGVAVGAWYLATEANREPPQDAEST